MKNLPISTQDKIKDSDSAVETTETLISRGAEIVRLHTEIENNLKMTLGHAIRIGGLLTAQKAELKHGEWLPWVEKNLPFAERTARDYIRFFQRREELKSASLADLVDARRLLEAPKKDTAKDSKRKRKKKTAAKVDSKVLQVIIELYRKLYQKATGESAFTGAAQYSIVGNLLRQQDEAEIKGRIRTYFAEDWWFTEGNNFSLRNFVAHYNEITSSVGSKIVRSVTDIASDEDYKEAADALHTFWTELKKTGLFWDFLETQEAMKKFDDKRYEDEKYEDYELLDKTIGDPKIWEIWLEDCGLMRRMCKALRSPIESVQVLIMNRNFARMQSEKAKDKLA